MTLTQLKKVKEGVNIYFKRMKFYATGWNSFIGMPLCTKEQYDNFIISFAHITIEGNIIRFGMKIGTVKDLSLQKQLSKSK